MSVPLENTILICFAVCLPDKLDGIRPMKRKREESPPFPLSDDDDPYDEREEDMRIGKKRVSRLLARADTKLLSTANST